MNSKQIQNSSRRNIIMASTGLMSTWLTVAYLVLVFSLSPSVESRGRVAVVLFWALVSATFTFLPIILLAIGAGKFQSTSFLSSNEKS